MIHAISMHPLVQGIQYSICAVASWPLAPQAKAKLHGELFRQRPLTLVPPSCAAGLQLARHLGVLEEKQGHRSEAIGARARVTAQGLACDEELTALEGLSPCLLKRIK